VIYCIIIKRMFIVYVALGKRAISPASQQLGKFKDSIRASKLSVRTEKGFLLDITESKAG
jgi:hypothetical protein